MPLEPIAASPAPTNTTNIVHRGEPSRTALRVAQMRAVHSLLDDPVVLHDPIALPILGTQAEALRENPFVLNDMLSRGLRAALVARSRFAEDELARAVAQGVRQYVLLGAGLDTFAYRNPHAQLQVFEVDHPSTQAWKRSLLAEAGIALPSNLRFAAADFEQQSLHDALQASGFEHDRPACFSWMGVTMYLRPEAVVHTLAQLAGSAPGSSVCFDFRLPPELLNPVELAISEFIGQQIAALGEPWIAAFEPEALREQLLQLGFREAEVVTGDALTERYLPRRKDGLRVPPSARLMLARR
jgi:methyltransferase (TIGR00027 family)